MTVLTKTQWLVLNATADDFEDLERIYRSLNLEFCAQESAAANSSYWRDANDKVPLAEIAECIRSLVTQGLLTVKMTEGGGPPSTHDLSYLWNGWFQMTTEGRALVESSASQWA